ncbi:MAG: hypothetical protein R3352_00080 [Salinisphaeraceae bacterium]|nr:hypothetical protein [Salinisphaeraceae bacterium]
MDRHTEIRRLAQALHKTENELDYLADLDAEGLHRLRLLLQNRIIDEFAHLFERMAAAGKVAPDSLSALLCKKVFGPTLSANMSYFIAVPKAIKLMKHFDAEFLADVTRHIVPDRAKEMLEGIPVDMMRDVTRQLLADQEYAIMGGFTDQMPEDKVLALMQELDEPIDCLRVSCYAQNKARIAKLTQRFEEDFLTELIHAAFTTEELIEEVGLITAEMDASNQHRMATLTDAANPAYRKQARKMAKKRGITGNLESYFAA